MYLPPQFKAKERSQALEIMRAHPLASLVTFMGPQAYMSPKVYPDLVRVPTWNYLAVHCTVQATLRDDAQAYAAQWRALASDYQQKMLSAITAFELQVLDLQCKVKLNQHRPESHVRMHAIYAAGNSEERALADWMVRLSFDLPAPVLPA